MEYERNGVAHLVLFYAPFDNWRRIQVSDNHAACQWAEGVRCLVQEDYPDAKRITLAMDNLNTHTGASLYKVFPPEIARALLDKLEFVYTPKHGSWLNMAECEFSVLGRQCLARRLPYRQTVTTEIAAWVNDRNQNTWPADRRFTTENARIKLKRLYPNLTHRWTISQTVRGLPQGSQVQAAGVRISLYMPGRILDNRLMVICARRTIRRSVRTRARSI